MAASKIEVPLSSEPRVYGRSRGSDYATYRRRRRHEGRQSLEGACRVVLLSREWGDPFPGLSQQRSGPLAIAGSSTYQGGAAIYTPPDTFSTAFDPPGGDFHFKPSAHYSRTLTRQRVVLASPVTAGNKLLLLLLLYDLSTLPGLHQACLACSLLHVSDTELASLPLPYLVQPMTTQECACQFL